MNKGSPAKQAYDKAYNARPEEKKKRALRNAARREYEEKHGDLPATMDVDHKIRMKHGGGNAMNNLQAKTQTANRGWRKGMKGYGK